MPSAYGVIGFRDWCLDQDRLVSGSGFLWGSGPLEAHCKEHSHPAPQKGCECGFYAVSSLDKLAGTDLDASQWEGMTVTGALRCWGTLEAHEIGTRSQFAEIIALGYPAGKEAAVRSLADAYKVAAVPMDELEAYAFQYGFPLAELLGR